MSIFLHRPIARLLGLAVVAVLAIGLLASSSSAGSMTKAGHGLLTVETSPSVATQITVGGIQRNTSLVRGLELPAGSHVVCFGPVEGYMAPPCESIDIADGQVHNHVAHFEAAGTLSVTTEPSGASGMIVVDDVARSRGTVMLPVTAGEHVVCFGEVGGYEAPDCASVTVAGGGSVSVKGSYVALGATEPEPISDEDEPHDEGPGGTAPAPPVQEADPAPGGGGGAGEPLPGDGELGDGGGGGQDDVDPAPRHLFSDVAEGVHRDAILRLTGDGIISGYPDGTFRPANHVTRGQVAALLARAFHLEAVACTDECVNLVDVAGSTHHDDIQAVISLGIASGYPDGTFGPERPVTREQLASMLAATLEFPDVLADHPFEDVRGTAHEARIAALYQAGITQGSSPTSFSPREFMRRDQFASLLSRSLEAS